MSRRPYSHPLVPSDERLDRVVQESVEALGERLRVVLDRRFTIPAKRGADDETGHGTVSHTETPAELIPPNPLTEGRG